MSCLQWWEKGIDIGVKMDCQGKFAEILNVKDIRLCEKGFSVGKIITVGDYTNNSLLHFDEWLNVRGVGV